jgi:hypothetical protein
VNTDGSRSDGGLIDVVERPPQRDSPGVTPPPNASAILRNPRGPPAHGVPGGFTGKKSAGHSRGGVEGERRG